MEKLIKKISPKYYWIVSFALGALAMFVMLSYSQVLSTGKYILLAGDSLQIYSSNMRMLVDNIIKGENLWFSFSMSMGLNTSLSLAFQMLSPFNVLYMIFSDKDFNVITAVVMILKTGLAAAAFQIFASKALKTKGLNSILFSLFYSMCAFAVLYGVFNFMWLDGLYALPFVALAVYVAAESGKYVFLTIAYTYIFIVQFYQGYMIGIFSLLYFILLMIFFEQKKEGMKIRQHIGKYLITAASSALISAILWVPLAMFLIKYHPTDSTEFESIGITAMELIKNMFWGSFRDYYNSPYVYCGIPVLILFPFFFANKKISLRTKLIFGSLLAFFAAACLFFPLYELLHAFDAPDMWNFRFTFILSFLLCSVACVQADYIEEIMIRPMIIYIVLLVLIYLGERFLLRLEYANLQIIQVGLFVNVALIGLWVLLTYLYAKKETWKTSVIVLILLLGAAECVTNGCYRMCSDSLRESFEREDYYYTWYREMNDSMQAIKESDNGDFYRMYILGDMNKNSDSFWGYNGINDFGTAENQTLREFLDGMGIYTTIRRTYITGITPSLEMLLSVKYKGRLYTATEVGGVEAPPKIAECDRWLPIGYMVNDAGAQNIEMTDNTFENQNRVFKALSGIDDLYKSVPEEKIVYEENGLVLDGDNKNIFMREDENDGSMVIRANHVNNDVYIQIASDAPKDELQGVYYYNVENMAETEDNSAWIPAAFKLWKSDDSHYIQLYTEGNYTIAFETNGIYIYECDEEVLNTIYQNLGKEVLQVESWKDGYVKGLVKTDGERKLLFTSIPNVEGWSVTVDGVKKDIRPVLNGTFLGVEVDGAGKHEVEFRYHCPGAGMGIPASFVGLILLGIQLFTEVRKHDR